MSQTVLIIPTGCFRDTYIILGHPVGYDKLYCIHFFAYDVDGAVNKCYLTKRVTQRS